MLVWVCSGSHDPSQGVRDEDLAPAPPGATHADSAPAFSPLQVKCYFWFVLLGFKLFYCLCGFSCISKGISVATHPLLKHLMVDKVISGHEMFRVSDNIF